MRDLVTETPYYSPQEPMLDVVQVDGRPRLTVVSARELDLRPRPRGGRDLEQRPAGVHPWAWPHPVLGDGDRAEPSAKAGRRRPWRPGAAHLLRQPSTASGRPADEEEESQNPARTTSTLSSASPVGLGRHSATRGRHPGLEGTPRTPYHYEGAGGIKLSSWLHRAAFALELGSKELLLSDDITSESRILLHRDVQRPTAARWRRSSTGMPHPAPLDRDGRIVFVVDGYTTSENYPYAERVELGGASVNYARASVRATVDAFSASVDALPDRRVRPDRACLGRGVSDALSPGGGDARELRNRLRYPADLFEAQANAYERFHTTRPDLFASGSDVWSPPTSLSGSLEVAGDIQFDEDDEDDLRLPMKPEYKFSPPPGQTTPRLVLATNYSPRRGQNLVASLDGWVDERGRARLAARSLPRDPVTLGPAQISRLVFSTPRVSHLLGLRNLELRDLDKSSLDTVCSGNRISCSSRAASSRSRACTRVASGPGVSRMIGVTAFLNGRAGVGSGRRGRGSAGAARAAAGRRPASRAADVVGTPVELALPRRERATRGHDDHVVRGRRT